MAASEVKTLIATSAREVARGVTLVHQAGDALDDIVGQSCEATELMQSITGSVREQAAALSEMTNALNDLDGATQTNANLVDVMKSLSGEMDDKARALRLSMERYDLSARSVPLMTNHAA